MSKTRATLMIIGSVTSVLLVWSLIVLATEDVKPGYDLFTTLPGTTFKDISGPAACAGVSLAGEISLRGEPISSFQDQGQSFDVSGTNTDTVVARRGGVPKGQTATVPIQIVALSLRGSVGGWDVRVTLSQVQSQPTGSATINHSNPNSRGGTFTSQLPVRARFEFRSGDQLKVCDPAPVISFNASGTWSHDPPANAARPDLSPNFFPQGAIQHDASGAATHKVEPARRSVPTLTEWGLLALALLLAGSLAFMIRRRFTPRPAGA
jgi:hypothetical protein